jgi:exopolysaccharide biosynthesis polyprenyl glycosylphosphotransferase
VIVEERTDGARKNAVKTTAVLEGGAARSAGRTRDFRQWSSRYVRLVGGFDVLSGMLAVSVAALFPTVGRPGNPIDWVLLLSAGAIVWPLAIAVAHGYRRRHIGIGSTEISAVLRAAAAVVVVGALPTAWFSLDGLLSTVAIGVPTAAVTSAGVRVAMRRRLHHEQRSGSMLRSVIMVGSAEAVQDLCEAVERERGTGMRVAGVCVPVADLDRARAMGLPVVGDIDHVAAVATDLGCHAVAVTGADATRQSFLRPLAWSLEGVDVDLMVHPGLIDVDGPRMHIQSYTGLSMVHVEQPRFKGWHLVAKRATDILLTSVGLLLISPLLLLIAVAIKLGDRQGPVIFRQTRIGIDGKPFTMYKFRSMVVDAEKRLADLKAKNEGAGPLFKIENDPRVTRIGRILRKYSLDELPQLFNVLAGSMSLVGPRPPLQAEVDEYAADIRRRLKVVPGLTGLWQVSGRSLLTWEESVRLDLRYVENWSMRLDLLIIWKTAFAVLAKRGAF